MKTYSLDFTENIDFKQVLKNPILDIAARFWDNERYEAFKVCYKSMRMIDDIVDNSKINNVISEEEKEKIVNIVSDWKGSVIGKGILVQNQVNEIISKFNIPEWPWKKLSESMIYDMKHSGFRTFQSFLEYAEGAAIAPASIFMHLCGIRINAGKYKQPQFDIKKTARPLAIFCYLVHIIRDFQKDQKDNLNYFAEDLMAENNLTAKTLKEIANGSKVTSEFRDMMKKYYSFIEQYRVESREMIDGLRNQIEPRYLLSLEIIYNLYLQIFEQIDVDNGNFRAVELNPSQEKIKERIDETISSFKANDTNIIDVQK